MGQCLDCLNPKPSNKKDQLIQSNDTDTNRSTEMQEANNKSLDSIDNIKDGKISDFYTLLNPPIYKGMNTNHIQSLYQGNVSEVRKAVHKVSGMQRAAKIISKGRCPLQKQQTILNEIEILKTLDHPNIIKYLEIYQDDQYIYIVTDLCTGGELFDKIVNEQHFSEKKAINIMKQILSAVSYIHSLNIVHRDLKPENFLFESPENNAGLKLINFGLSRNFQPNEVLTHKMGTPYYIAPEVLKQKYNEKCDIWSCGVILYILLFGSPPFSGTTDAETIKKVSIGEFSFGEEGSNNISLQGKELIKKMLELDPAKRYSAQQCLADPWMKKFQSRTSVDAPIMQQVLSNMNQFRIVFQSQQKLQDAAYMYMVNYLTTKEEQKAMLATFKELDTDGNGTLSREELLVGYTKLVGAEKAKEMVDNIMSQVDKNNSGSIDYSEFVGATMNRQQILSRERLEATFKTFDSDGSGSISIKELKNIFGSQIDDDLWNDMVKDVDVNGDGEVRNGKIIMIYRYRWKNLKR